jgi:hypothetical protein
MPEAFYRQNRIVKIMNVTYYAAGYIGLRSGLVILRELNNAAGEQHECRQDCEEGAHSKMLVPNAVPLNLHGMP